MIQQKLIKIFRYYLRKKKIYEVLSKNTLAIGSKESKNNQIKIKQCENQTYQKKRKVRQN
ncbi:unnamed protein product [Paramecium pentaurelia]|uniref:Uncharacterized protein n=1 Tax=Paramecium pentaurelia TaxID=43138 RepID=A0A8S1YHD7_9CILI|nr:unnamed protein product [Paramecium pentaurelia]